MTNVLVTTRKRFLRSLSTSEPPPSTLSPAITGNGSRSTLTMPPSAKQAEVAIAPKRREAVVPIHPVREYGDPAKILEHKQFIEFGCGACHHHRLKGDRSAYYCAVEISLWPDGTNKTCRWFMRRNKRLLSDRS